MKLSERIEALEQRKKNSGYQVWFQDGDVYFQEPGVPVDLPADAHGLIFEFSDRDESET